MYAEKYQWVKGEKTGKVEIYSSHDTEWVYFQGGARISAQLLPEYMLPADGNNAQLDLSITRQRVEDPVAQTKKTPTANKKDDNNPVKSLIRQAAKDNLECNYNFEISIPKIAVYNLIRDSFETEVDDLILELVMADIKPNDLYKQVQEQIKEQILKFYGRTSNDTGESGSQESTASSMDEQSPA